MRKVCLVALCLLLCGAFAFAQDPKAEVFAGYSFLHADTGGGPDSNAPAGFNLDGTYYFAHAIGATADFQYHHKDTSDIIPGTSLRTISLHFGPRVKVRMGKIEPFAHGLFGFTDLSANASVSGVSASISDKAFSMKLGGGVDVPAARHFAIRLGEFNYYYTHFTVASGFSLNGQDHQNNFTYSAGIVIR